MAEYPALEISFLETPDSSRFDLLYVQLDDFAPLAIHEDETDASWRVFFRSASERDAAC